MEIAPAAESGCGVAGRREIAGLAATRLGLRRVFETPDPMHQTAPIHWSQNATASAYVGWDEPNIGKDRTSGKWRHSICTGNVPKIKTV
jgi:hypothetical protein